MDKQDIIEDVPAEEIVALENQTDHALFPNKEDEPVVTRRELWSYYRMSPHTSFIWAV